MSVDPPWRAVHDLGGVAEWNGPIDRADHAHGDWEARTDAIISLLRLPAAGQASLDELRRHIEALGDAYPARAYGERTLHGLVQTLLERAVVTPAELGARLRSGEGEPAPAHDVGGAPHAPCVPTEHAYAHWEHRVDALMQLLGAKERRLLRVDELRRNIESLGPDAYARYGYYERWMHAVAQILIQRGVISLEELEGKLGGR